MNKFIYILLTWLVLMWACDPCEDCGQPLEYDPSVKMIFINQDSIVSIKDSILFNTDSIARIDTVRLSLADSVRTLTDTINALNLLISSGNTQYVAQKNRFVGISDSLDVVVDTLNIYKTRIRSLNTEMNKVISAINGGSIQLSEVLLVTNNINLFFEDSMKSFSLPLLIGEVGSEQETSYRVIIVEDTFYISLQYSSYETVDAARVARIRTRNIDTVSHSFDSLNINCRTADCLSDETTLTVYF
ncbi:MAG: hypothetical protein RIC35_11655 [Marinoscillum sp.]